MRYILFLFIACIIYSIIRYVAFAPENVGSLPAFILNKGIAMGAALSFAFAFLQQWRRKRGRRIAVEPRIWFRAGIVTAIAHIPLSLVILRPGYFPEFFAGERLSFGGEAVFLFGALTAGGIYLLHRTGWDARTRWWLSLATLGVLFAHVLSMGLLRGLNINLAHAYLPPMWLLSLIGIAAGIGWLLRLGPEAEPPPPGPPRPSAGARTKEPAESRA